jgi:hypothetical protein
MAVDGGRDPRICRTRSEQNINKRALAMNAKQIEVIIFIPKCLDSFF